MDCSACDQLISVPPSTIHQKLSSHWNFSQLQKVFPFHTGPLPGQPCTHWTSKRWTFWTRQDPWPRPESLWSPPFSRTAPVSCCAPSGGSECWSIARGRAESLRWDSRLRRAGESFWADGRELRRAAWRGTGRIVRPGKDRPCYLTRRPWARVPVCWSGIGWEWLMRKWLFYRRLWGEGNALKK